MTESTLTVRTAPDGMRCLLTIEGCWVQGKFLKGPLAVQATATPVRRTIRGQVRRLFVWPVVPGCSKDTPLMVARLPMWVALDSVCPTVGGVIA